MTRVQDDRLEALQSLAVLDVVFLVDHEQVLDDGQVDEREEFLDDELACDLSCHEQLLG